MNDRTHEACDAVLAAERALADDLAAELDRVAYIDDPAGRLAALARYREAREQ